MFRKNLASWNSFDNEAQKSELIALSSVLGHSFSFVSFEHRQVGRSKLNGSAEEATSH